MRSAARNSSLRRIAGVVADHSLNAFKDDCAAISASATEAAEQQADSAPVSGLNER